jgi:penicillin-binding protein 2A
VKKRSWLLGIMAMITLGLFIFIAGYAVIYFNGQKLLMQNLEKLDMPEATIVYDNNGKEFAKILIENRELVTLEQIPDKLEEAVIATEDQRFGEHAGVDLWSIGRAIYRDILHQELKEGGSTITQQVAKNMFLSPEKTFFRKATEVSIALALEKNFSKDEILEMYLNRINFGNGAYGVKAAAKYHFGVSDLNDLSLLEMAVLAGAPKAPSTYSPTNHPDRALERAAVVLQLMTDQGYITEEERREAINSELRKPSAKMNRSASAIRDYILDQAEELTGLSEDELRIGGYRIYTTVDTQAQRAVDTAFDNPELFPEDGPEQIAQGAMAIIDPKTGGIAAMSGGRNYVTKGLNRALNKNRQPGSAFKPVAVYAPALETGNYTPYSMLKDAPIDFNGYKPSNLSGKYAGEMTMFEAVKRSINLPAVWLLNEIGVKRGYQFAKDLGIELAPEDRNNLAIALGGVTQGVSPLEMARAYGAFDNGGKLAETHVITSIQDSQGNTIYSFKPSEKKVMSEQTAYYMTLLLQGVTEKGGTGVKANFGRPVAGKTGTTQIGVKGVKNSSGNRDVWFVGYTPEYAAAVWMGFDDTNKTHYLKSGSGTAAHLFATVMSEALKGRKETSFTRPKDVEEPKKGPTEIKDLAGAYDPERKQAILAWSPMTEKDVEYRLYRKEASEEAYQLLISTQATEVADITVQPGFTYQYYVTVYSPGSNQESAASNIVDVIVPLEGEGSDEGVDLPDLNDILPPIDGEPPVEGEPGAGDEFGQPDDGFGEQTPVPGDGNGSGSGQGQDNGQNVPQPGTNNGNAGQPGGTDNSGTPPAGSDAGAGANGDTVVIPDGL